MEAKELRIGNYVNFEFHKDCGGVKGVEVFISDLEIILHNSSKSKYYTPIPLTEEWHNKFGVKINGFKIFEYTLPRKNNLDIKVIFNGDYVMLRQGKGDRNDDILSIWNKDLTNRDMFVHEWQNLYSALTNEELKLK